MTLTEQYPALRRFERDGISIEGIPVLLGYAEVAAAWGINTDTVRTLFRDTCRRGDWRYVPKPDVLGVRDDTSVLPFWKPETIEQFERLESIQGRGNHTYGENRRGYTKGAHTYAYRIGLGVNGAEELRKEHAAGASVEDLAAKWELRVDEAQNVVDGKRWLPGTGKDRGPGLPRGVVAS